MAMTNNVTVTATTDDRWPDHQPHSTTYHDHRPRLTMTTNSMVCKVAAAARGQQEQEQWLMVRRVAAAVRGVAAAVACSTVVAAHGAGAVAHGQ